MMNGDLSATIPSDLTNSIRTDRLLQQIQIQVQKIGTKDHNTCSEIGAGISSDLVNSGHKHYRKITTDLEKREGPSKMANSHLISDIPDLLKERMSLTMRSGEMSQISAEENHTRGNACCSCSVRKTSHYQGTPTLSRVK